MKGSNLNNGTRKLMGNNYIPFCASMCQSAEFDALPQFIELKDTKMILCQDIADLCQQFEEDTGLEMTGNFYYCDDCEALHVILKIDFFDEEEPFKPLLQ